MPLFNIPTAALATSTKLDILRQFPSRTVARELAKYGLTATPDGLIALVNVHMQSITLQIKFNEPEILNRPVGESDKDSNA